MARIIMIISVFLFWSCKENPATTNDAHTDHQPAEQSMGIMLTESQVKLANINTQKITAASAERQVSVNARLVINEDLTEVISARMQGRLEKLYHKETGKPVRKGEPLYEIYSEQLLTLQNDFLLAMAQYDEFKNVRYEDYLKSARKKLILYGLTEKQVDELAKSKEAKSRITFLAPVSGMIKTINVTEGQYVSEGSALYQLENTSRLWVEAELYPGEGNRLKPGASFMVRIAGFENDPVQSTVKFVSPEYRANSQVLVVRGELENKNNQWQTGMQAQVFLKSDKNNTISVPVDAIIRDEHGAMVFIKSDEHTFVPRMIKTGLETFSSIEILDGVKEGEELVISGAYLIYSELILKNGNEILAHQH